VTAGAGDLVATALARGELRAIAVATPDEERKAFDSDSALARRFVRIPVEPPTIDEAVAVVRGVVRRFEIDHGVRIADPALVSAVQLSKRYVPGVQLPKSAIDLIDEAAARVRVEMESIPAELDALERRLETIEIQHKSLEDDHDAESVRTRERLDGERQDLGPKIEAMRERWNRELELVGEVRRLKEEVAAAERELDQARGGDDQERAGELRFGTIPHLERQLAEAEKTLSDHGETMVHDTVLPEDVADVVAAWTGVPVSKMMEEEADKLLQMETRLRERVVGQDPALEAVSKAVRRGRVGLRDPKRPIGSFLFLGPTGVGKTELAKALAEFLFDDEHALTRLDMSEFMEKHMVARLLGAPPGYVDSEEGGFLTEAVRQRPYSVILFDEMEKAHPDVFNILLQVLDDGLLTDSRGRPAHFTDTVIIMTSNVGSQRILDHEGSLEELRDKIDDALHASFRPEFLNRVDDVVIFDPLEKDDLRGIVDIQLRHLGELLADKRLSIDVTDAAKDHIVELGYEPAYGARPIKRVILKQLQDPLAEELLRGGWDSGATIRIDVNGDKFVFSTASG
ncbi:MAG: AAA family ATPase, partial [Polyangiales bacterium]